MIVNRLKEYIDKKGITVSAFEKSIGMANASFGKSLKNNGAIGTDKLEKILSIYPDISSEWLIRGNGDMLKKSASTVPEEVHDTALTVVETMKNRIVDLESQLREKEKQVSDLIKMNLYLLEREKEGGHSMPESAKNDRSAG